MNKQAVMKLVFAVVLLSVSTFIFIGFIGERRQREELTYFYDLSERKLFTAPRAYLGVASAYSR